jgi:CxxC-x17-CxxC domain-containing protein
LGFLVGLKGGEKKVADLTDQTIKCADCGKDFVWSASEQAFYQEKGFDNAPKRCPDCRRKRKEALRANRPMYDAVCAKCGKPCQVPFKPREDRPVYCSDCYRAMRAKANN